ncbi:hypothetical protein PRK78_005508 [Emydomyces testavorans]|uniref:Aminoglycoside phosphotransferase domain-containing protein n=1 Tax=Emydomyces testavorans TaxID=2070801 RepID=A0AAF0IJL0_9EURO|nr:hypothetical protein PRK78_005508 [Emydomyces testavorans]
MAQDDVAPKLMEYDDLAWNASDAVFDKWKKDELFDRNRLFDLGMLIDKWRGGVAEELCSPGRGAFNVWFRMKFVGGSAVARIPSPGKSMFPEEKIQREVAVMQFLQMHTNIPVPFVFHSGPADENPSGFGPFIIMEYVTNESDLVDVLNTPGFGRQDRPILNPQISEEQLRLAYAQMADIILQLNKSSFDAIGSIDKVNKNDDFDDRWEVKYRPLTLNMNELVQLGGVSPSLLPQGPFKTTSSYYLALAEMHMIHLASQRNDAIDSAEDCKRKYIARCLFRKLAREGRLCDNASGPFKLFCDDLRPANVLVGAGCKLAGAVDWEFTYAAPPEFAHSPPFWLLLESPEFWDDGFDNWTELYEKRLETFLNVLAEREKDALNRQVLREPQHLAERMKESWKNGDFWVTYAARKSWAFDLIYWAKIDKRFFGDGDLEERFQLLTIEEQVAMDNFIQRKMKQKEEHTLPEWPPS